MVWVLPLLNIPQAFSKPGSSVPAPTAPQPLQHLGTIQHVGLYQVLEQLLMSLTSNSRTELTR